MRIRVWYVPYVRVWYKSAYGTEHHHLMYHDMAILVSRGQTLFFAQGLYRFQYKRPARKRVWESSQCILVQRPTDIVGR